MRATSMTGLKILDALGLPAKSCARITVEFTAQEPVIVRAEYYPDTDAIDRVIEIVRELVPKK